jgi:hypothetical protein
MVPFGELVTGAPLHMQITGAVMLSLARVYWMWQTVNMVKVKVKLSLQLSAMP